MVRAYYLKSIIERVDTDTDRLFQSSSDYFITCRSILNERTKIFRMNLEFKKLNIVTSTSKPAKTYQNVFK